MKKLVLIFIALFGFSSFSNSRLDQLAHAFDLLKMEKMTPYEFGLQAVDYWDDEKSLEKISDQKYCLEVQGIHKVVESESRKEEGKVSLERFSHYFKNVRDLDSYCKDILAQKDKQKKLESL